MGKHLQRNDSIVDGNYPSCMCGIMHFLDYHHWQSVKKLIPHKKNGGRRRIKYNGSPKRILKNRDSGKVFMDADGEPLLVKQQSTDSIPASRRSGKPRLKSMNTEERQESHRHWILSFSLHSWLQRANPVHHLEPSENCLGHTAIGTANAADVRGNDYIARKQVAYPANCNMVSGSQNLMKANQQSTDISNQELDDSVDIMEIFKVNKEFFLKILQDPDVRKNQFHGLKNSNIKVRLTKSRSFPVPNTSQARNIKPSTLKHKQNEVWFFLSGEKSVAGTGAQKLEDSKLQKAHYINSVTDHDTTGDVNNHGWNRLVINRFRDIKQKIKQALKESKKEHGHTAVDADYQSDPFGGRTSIDGTEMSERLQMTIGQDGNKIDISNDDLRKRRLQRVRRTSSLNESLDRYTQLFENAFGRETKYRHSRSLRVTTEEKVPSNARKSCRTNLSLPDLDSFSSFLNGTPYDAPIHLVMPNKTLVDHITHKDRDNQTELESLNLAVNTDLSQPLEGVIETELQRSGSSANIEYSGSSTVDGKEETTSITDNIVEDENKPARESSAYQEEEIFVTNDPKEELSQPNYKSVIETCIPEDLTNSAEFPTSEGLESNLKRPQTEDPDSLIIQQDSDSLPDCHSASNRDVTETGNITRGNLSQHFQSENADFNYIQALLELSGFIGNDEQAWTWHSLDQPLSPSLFKEMEEDNSQNEVIEEEEEEEEEGEEVAANSFINRHLLFDLVNETLGEMIEKSYTYFPRGFSFGSNIRRTPKGHQLVEEVWERRSKNLSLRPELDQTLDDVVARDLGKGDGWMKLESESEMVALEIEDLIFDQLLDEVICS
ncbi:hypothetical protein PanWU01x14_326140 [Parasponia andersonii]|uniref:Uncharacterized protein n=1 Tax=Parasponia andersonii TaxID=3476 RepID=A0A2P5AJJ4_PARAD|nr:hypothetical protein PanWU01x14_326140 [Parasponia andersonii]